MKQLGPYRLESTLCREGAVVTYSGVHFPSGGTYLVHVLETESVSALFPRLEQAKSKGLPVVIGYLDGAAVAVTPVLANFAGLPSWLQKAGIPSSENFALVTGPAARKLQEMADPASRADVTDPRARFAKLVDRYSQSGANPIVRPQPALASGLTTNAHPTPAAPVIPESEYSRVFTPVRPTASLPVPIAPSPPPPTHAELERLRLWALGGWATAFALGLLLLASLLTRWRTH